MDLDTRDLDLLEALERTGTLTAAAAELFVSQPALSQRLGRLEEHLGAALFERRGRRLVPTRAGRRMQQAARSVLTELRTAEQDLRELVDGLRRPLRLTSQCTMNYEWLAPLLHAFRERRPDTEVRIEAVSDHETIAALLEERIDLALVTKLEREMVQVRLQRLFDDEMVAVVAATHPWAARRHLEAADFADSHLVLYDTYDQQRADPVPLPIPPGARPARLTTLPFVTDLLMEMVTSGDAVTVMPTWIAEPYLRSHDLVTVQVGAQPQLRTWYCATRHCDQSESTQAFVDLLERHFADRGAPRLLVG